MAAAPENEAIRELKSKLVEEVKKSLDRIVGGAHTMKLITDDQKEEIFELPGTKQQRSEKFMGFIIDTVKDSTKLGKLCELLCLPGCIGTQEQLAQELKKLVEIKRKHAEAARKKVKPDSPGDDRDDKPEDESLSSTTKENGEEKAKVPAAGVKLDNMDDPVFDEKLEQQQGETQRQPNESQRVKDKSKDEEPKKKRNGAQEKHNRNKDWLPQCKFCTVSSVVIVVVVFLAVGVQLYLVPSIYNHYMGGGGGSTSIDGDTPKETPTPPAYKSRLDEKPQLDELQRFTWNDQGTQRDFRLIEQISHKCTKLRTAMNFPESMLSLQDKWNQEECCRSVLGKWLEGGSKGSEEYPVTWGGLIKVVKDIDLRIIADELKDALGKRVK